LIIGFLLLGLSAFGGHSWLISPEKLYEKKLLSKEDFKAIDQSKFHHDYVYFKQVQQYKDDLLHNSFRYFQANNAKWEEILNEFFRKEISWIDHYTLFMTIHQKVRVLHSNIPLPKAIRQKDEGERD
jgi:4-alpha-glucanotransferase